MAEVNFDELFGNFSAADALATTESTKKGSSFSGRADLYKPTIRDEKCVDMNYRALIRFIPFFYEGKWRTILSRWECYLKDVNGENGLFVVSPKTGGKNCPIRSLSYQLFKSNNAIDQKNSKKINVYQQFYALVEIVSDAQHPEYNGKIFIYQFGAKINEKIESAMKSTQYEEGFNPFALYDGRLFEINLTKDPAKKMENGSPVTNYDGCRFTTKISPIHFGDGQTLDKDSDSQHAFLEWLESGAPKIKDYLWKEWDAETTEKVNRLLSTYKSGYSAPRTSTADAMEMVKNVTENPISVSKPVEKPVDVVIPENKNEDEITDDNDAWIDSVLNG